MIAQKVGSRYAKAFFKFKDSLSQHEKRLKNLETFLGLLNDNPKWRHFFLSNQVSKPEKGRILQKGLTDKVDPLLLSFLLILVEKGRFNYLPEIIDAYRRMVKEEAGIVEATLITAIPADEKLRETLKKKLEKSFQKEIELKETVDAKIIGGAIIVVQNKMLDFSIRSRLAKLKEDLLSINI